MKGSSGLWIGRLNIVKLSILSKVIDRYNTSPIKTPIAFLAEMKNLSSNSYGRARALRSQNNLDKGQSWRTYNS